MNTASPLVATEPPAPIIRHLGRVEYEPTREVADADYPLLLVTGRKLRA